MWFIAQLSVVPAYFLDLILHIHICQSDYASIILLYCEPKVQVGCLLSLCDSRWKFVFLSVSEEIQEAQVLEPEQGEASGDVWGVGLEDILYMNGEHFGKWNTVFWKLLVYSRPTVNDVYFIKFLEVLSWRLILEYISNVMWIFLNRCLSFCIFVLCTWMIVACYVLWFKFSPSTFCGLFSFGTVMCWQVHRGELGRDNFSQNLYLKTY